MLLGITGKKRSGKNTVGQYLQDKYRFNQHAFADNIKKLVLEINPIIGSDYKDGYGEIYLKEAVEKSGWEKAKEDHYVREFLQNLGVRCREVFGKNLWADHLWKELIKKYDTYNAGIKSLNYTINDLPSFKYEGEDVLVKPNLQSNVVITDVRFENEAQRIRDYSGYVIHLIGRGEEGDTHMSEQILPPQYIQFTVDNSGTTEELYEKIDDILRRLEFNKIK